MGTDRTKWNVKEMTLNPSHNPVTWHKCTLMLG